MANGNVQGEFCRFHADNHRITNARYLGGDTNDPDDSNPLWVTAGDNNVFDHCTIAFGADQNLTTGPPTAAGGMFDQGYQVKGLTVQNSIIGHGLQYQGHSDDPDNTGFGHSHGVYVGPRTLRFRLYRSLLTCNTSRALAHFQPEADKIVMEIMNCIVYNPTLLILRNLVENDANVATGTRINVRNCLIIEGPDSDYDGWPDNWPLSRDPFFIGTSGRIHMSGNLWLKKNGPLSQINSGRRHPSIEPWLRIDEDVDDVETRFLTQAERDAIPDDPFPVDLDDVPVLETASLPYELLVRKPVGAGGLYERWAIGQVWNRTGRIIDSLDDLPEDIRLDVQNTNPQ